MTQNRQRIVDIVEQNEAISFSKLKKETGLANGVVQHHVRRSNKLKKEKGAIVATGTCQNCDLRDKCSEVCLKKELNKERVQEILRLKDKGLKNIEIAKKIDVDPSTVTYYLNRLKDLDLI